MLFVHACQLCARLEEVASRLEALAEAASLGTSDDEMPLLGKIQRIVSHLDSDANGAITASEVKARSWQRPA